MCLPHAAAVCVLVLALCGTTIADASCEARILESIPNGVDLQTNETIYAGWVDLLEKAERSLDIASFYFTLSDGSKALGGAEGAEVLHQLRAAGERGVAVRIAQSVPEPESGMPDLDSLRLAAEGLADVRNVSMSKFFGSGVMHTKFFIVDGKHFYIGSANSDWRSLTQVKELGVVFYDCAELVQDLMKVFEIYWQLAKLDTLPSQWPADLSTHYNHDTPAHITINGEEAAAFFSSAPFGLCASGRTYDLDAIVFAINAAQQSVSISVMDYAPETMFTDPKVYFPPIDDALRAAVFRGVSVRMMVSRWNTSSPEMFPFLKSLQMVNDACIAVGCKGSMEIRLFVIPDDTKGVEPYTRVNHAKYMVTEQVAFIGTSNWSGDYFLNTAGVGLTLDAPTMVSQLQSFFERDWHSDYLHSL